MSEVISICCLIFSVFVIINSFKIMKHSKKIRKRNAYLESGLTSIIIYAGKEISALHNATGKPQASAANIMSKVVALKNGEL